MTTNSSAPLARIRDLHDLLGVIPHLLGFHPDESLVIIVMDGAQVQVTARVDLTDVATGGQVEMLIDRLLLRWPSATVWLVGYSASETDAWRVLQRAEDHAGEALAGEPLCVSAGHYRVGDASGPRYRHDPTSTQSAAAATVHGLQARPNRAVLRAEVRVDPAMAAEAERHWVTALDRLAGFDAHQLPDEMARALALHLNAPFGVPSVELAWLAVLANVPAARDRALVAISRDDADAHVELWSRVVRACPYGTQQHALSLLGMAAWVSGNGALQSVCLEELEQQGADLALQGMLEKLNEGIVPPSYWDELRPELLEAITPLPSELRADQAAREIGHAHGEGADHKVA